MSPRAPAPLSTTSYAILGLLSIRSWTGYELAQQGRRSLAYLWSKTDSVMYEEPRRLVAHGYATTTREQEGGRWRNRYTITDAGREGLAAWLAQPSAPPRFEIESFLRLLFADQAGKEEALVALGEARVWAQEQLELGIGRVDDYLQTGGPFPDRAHINALGGYILSSIWAAIVSSVELAEKEIASWNRTDGLGMTPRTREIFEEIRRIHGPPS